MIYVDTSILVALCTTEEKSEAVDKWYEKKYCKNVFLDLGIYRIL